MKKLLLTILLISGCASQPPQEGSLEWLQYQAEKAARHECLMRWVNADSRDALAFARSKGCF